MHIIAMTVIVGLCLVGVSLAGLDSHNRFKFIQQEGVGSGENWKWSSESCALPPDTGPCRASFPRFYFNAATRMCSSFIWGGCAGNGNRFHTADQCASYCSGVGRRR